MFIFETVPTFTVGICLFTYTVKNIQDTLISTIIEDLEPFNDETVEYVEIQ